MRTLSILLFVCVAAACGQDLQADRKLWLTSVTTLAAANALDIHSSWGKRELNQTLASPSGNFGRQGAMLKAGFQAGLLGFECFLIHHRPSGKLNKVLSVVNFGAAAVVGGVAARNYTIPRTRR
jgi:hypothetical protein